MWETGICNLLCYVFEGNGRSGIIESTARICYVVLMAIVPLSEIPIENRRRSKRVQYKTPVVVRFQGANKQSISEKTHTIIVSAHGALILLEASVKTQQIIRLENLSIGEELLCRVVSLGPTLMGKTQVAVEFIVPKPGFWGTLPNSKTSESGRSLKK
jgi:PilZ domain